MMVVLDVFMEWYEAARGQTRTTETVVFCDIIMENVPWEREKWKEMTETKTKKMQSDNKQH